MNPEIFAKISQIIAKTGDRVIVVDPKSGAPFVLMTLTEYEKWVDGKPKISGNKPLTANSGSGSIEADLALWQGAPKGKDDWGIDETVEEDKYYMEPTE